jgi:hypothetical protein
MGTETKNNAIGTVIAMLDEQIGGLADEIAELAKAMEELTTVRELTAGLLDATTDERPTNGVGEALAASVSRKLEAGGLVVGEAVFTYEQRNWAAVYKLMLDGMTYLGAMQTAMKWGGQSGKQRTRDCLRSLREMGLVVKGPNADSRYYLAGDTPNALTSSDVVVGPNPKQGAYEFLPRQWRWQDAHMLVRRGCRTTRELAGRFGHGWTVKQASGLLYQLKNLGLIEKQGKRGWHVTDREVIYYKG